MNDLSPAHNPATLAGLKPKVIKGSENRHVTSNMDANVPHGLILEHGTDGGRSRKRGGADEEGEDLELYE